MEQKNVSSNNADLNDFKILKEVNMNPDFYPDCRRDEVIDNYHGTDIADPYRWLEDPAGEDTVAWVEAQNKITDSFIRKNELFDRWYTGLEKRWNYAKPSLSRRYGKRVFYFRADGLSNQPVLYMREDGQVDEAGKQIEKEVINPNNLSEDGTRAISVWKCNGDGSVLVYSLSASGSDWQEIHTLKIDETDGNKTEPEYSEILHHCRFPSISWNSDYSGFFYTRSPAPGEVEEIDRINYGKVFFHRLGTSQKEDVLIWKDENDKTLNPHVLTSADGSHLLLSLGRSCDPKNKIYIMKIGDEFTCPNSSPFVNSSGTDYVNQFIKVVDNEDNGYMCCGSKGSTFYFQNDTNAPKWRLLSLNASELSPPLNGKACKVAVGFKEILPESEFTLKTVAVCKNALLVVQEDKACHRLFLYDFDGTLKKEIELAGLGSIAGLWGSSKESDAYFGYSSFLQPPVFYQIDSHTGDVSEANRHEAIFDGTNFETKQVFVESKDGTKVPMFVTCKKDIILDGTNPVILYGYGGFGISLNPGFSVVTSAWVENGGVYVVTNLRGGGEFGRQWHEDGRLHKKQNVFDDFISCGKYLVDKGYTSEDKLAIWGGSNGGLLTAACMLQAPELFKAVVSSVPVIDMLRFHKFTCGRYWVSDYGNGEENKEDFDTLMKYSPLHNVKDGVKYPSVFVMTADTDDRVVPMHGKKFVATLQAAALAGKVSKDYNVNPAFLRVELKAGHGHGKPVAKRIESAAYMYSFICQILDMKPEVF